MKIAVSPADSLLFPPVCKEVPVLSLDRRASPDVDGELFTLRLRSPGWKDWQPGQFIMIRPQSATRTDIFWGRPFSISQANKEELRVVFQVAGRGTEGLLRLERGELVTVWGPLGNAFAISRSRPTLLLAGGIGIAPFVGYIQRHPSPENLRLEFGHRLHIDCYPFAECLGAECPGSGHLDAETLSANYPGLKARSHQECGPEDLARFISTLEESIRETAERGGLVLACGPMPFLKSVQKFALRYRAKTQLSLETRMACGVGACLGCVVKNTTPGTERTTVPSPEAFSYMQTCTNGPVFWADELDLENA